jgi:hypothetical protein
MGEDIFLAVESRREKLRSEGQASLLLEGLSAITRTLSRLSIEIEMFTFCH